jgi:hypothetical protein
MNVAKRICALARECSAVERCLLNGMVVKRPTQIVQNKYG